MMLSTFLTLSILLPAAAHGQRPSISLPPVEMMQIDGAKNPEMIPQWSAWGFAFRVIAGGELPSAVLTLVSPAEAALLRREATAVQAIDQRCSERMLALTKQLRPDKRAALETESRALTVECRWETLHARDRVLEGFNAAAGQELMAYVESTKAGTSISLPRKALARYLEPQ